MRVKLVVTLDTETRALKVEGAGDPLLALTALDLAHAKVLAQFQDTTRQLEVVKNA